MSHNIPVPTESKSSINKAGKTLVQTNVFSDEYQTALELANKWRACHAYPINTFQATLRTKIKNCKGEVLVAQRLKRMPTIIDKLVRFPNMQLTTMQDIAGIRGIFDNLNDIEHIVNKYVENKNFPHELVGNYDYISNPRDVDGYRSHHLVYKYNNKQNPIYDGLRVEIQLRTKLQHIWATAVETMGTFLGQALKSKQGEKEWLDFFALVSSAFSFLENTPQVPRFSHFSRQQTIKEVAKMEQELGAIEKMKNFSTVVSSIGNKKSYTYHLIVLNSLKHTIDVHTYDRENFEVAMADYAKFEEEAAKGSKLEPVLVSAGPMENLRKAYPNLFLDITEFETTLMNLIKS
ncbi:MAG: RelA/SpoT domain-containing protein [Cyclobacteriaceae bacterium]|nr:RelA/SpoT domain-containing protein [Cyclobacteriaceae bacterium]